MIAERVAELGPSLALDWGAGWGQLTARIQTLGVACEAYDYVEDVPAGHRASDVYPDVQIRHSADPVRLPYNDGQFDLVLSCGVLEHVADPRGSLLEIRRVLTPGGRLLVFKLPNRYSYIERAARYSGQYYHGQAEHDRVYTLSSARRLVSEAGFRVVSARRADLLPLAIPDPRLNRVAGQIWALNKALSRIPGISLFATTIEIEALKT